jgi:indole-3-glycerol phosphate synthase
MKLNILDRIVSDKRREVASKKSMLTLEFIKGSPLIKRKTLSLSNSIKEGSGVIAEFKRRSPSKQVINHKSSIIDVVKDYVVAEVSGISVLTDTKYFGGALDDLIQARDQVNIPLLRKEFIIDSYQIYESKAYGADAILLIAAVLKPEEIYSFSQLAHDLELEVLLEIHNEEELRKSDLTYIDMVGVNNRNLKTFEVRLQTSMELSSKIPDDKGKISESGISSITSIKQLKNYGYRGFLIGENFMSTDDPGKAAVEFIKALANEN